jgi:voltage-gated potassium channel Kch
VVPKDPSKGVRVMVMEDGTGKLNILDSIYFVIVTLLTVGYGDIMPSTIPGKLIGMSIITVTIVMIPTETSHLLDLLSS